MLFSEKFEIEKHILEEYGAIDISLVCDIPLFIDPMLIFNSEKPQYKILHNNIIKYFHFLAKKSEEKLNISDIKTWYTFNEVCNNWFGYALEGNKGSALDIEFGKFLYNNIKFALCTNGIPIGEHAEKIMLLYDGSGRDKISDMTVNLIKGFLCEYTQEFAKKYLKETDCMIFPVDKAGFNYSTESFITKEYFLPYIINEKGEEEFILLTPSDILRKNEPSINRDNLFKNNRRVRDYIDNDVLKTQVNNYIAKAVGEYEKEQRINKKKPSESKIKAIEKEAFSEMVKEHPEIYDYYIKMREEEKEEIKKECLKEVDTQLGKFINNAKELINKFEENKYEISENCSAVEESRNRIKFFKHIIEDCDGYKTLYYKNERISNENDLQRMFKLVWYQTSFKADFETNNGRGPADVVVSKGSKNQNIIEFKLGSNPNLKHVFEQTEIYKKANGTEKSIIVVFYFSEKELIKVHKIINEAGCNDRIDKDIILIDCRNDNKKSASKP
jgi:hypothetical protein